MNHDYQTGVSLSDSVNKTCVKSGAAPPRSGLTTTSYPTCNKTSLSRKPCILDKELLWNETYLLPVNGSHLWFMTDPNICHSYEYSSCVARPRNHGYSRWNFVAITYTAEDTSVIYVLPVHGRHFLFRHGVLSSVIFDIGGNSAVLKNIISITVSLTIDLLH